MRTGFPGAGSYSSGKTTDAHDTISKEERVLQGEFYERGNTQRKAEKKRGVAEKREPFLSRGDAGVRGKKGEVGVGGSISHNSSAASERRGIL